MGGGEKKGEETKRNEQVKASCIKGTTIVLVVPLIQFPGCIFKLLTVCMEL